MARTTFHKPTLIFLEDEAAVEGRFVDDEAGDGEADVWRVYAERDDALPNRFDATASILEGESLSECQYMYRSDKARVRVESDFSLTVTATRARLLMTVADIFRSPLENGIVRNLQARSASRRKDRVHARTSGFNIFREGDSEVVRGLEAPASTQVGRISQSPGSTGCSSYSLDFGGSKCRASID